MRKETIRWFDIWSAAVAVDASKRNFHLVSAYGLHFQLHVWAGRLFWVDHPMAFK